MKGGDKVTIGDGLIELRGDRTQAEVAEAVGIATTTLCMYERNERVPRDEIKVKLAKYYNTSVEELFYSPRYHNQ